MSASQSSTLLALGQTLVDIRKQEQIMKEALLNSPLLSKDTYNQSILGLDFLKKNGVPQMLGGIVMIQVKGCLERTLQSRTQIGKAYSLGWGPSIG